MSTFLKSRLLWVIAFVGAMVGLYALVGFLVAPGIVKDQAQQFVREKYGRSLEIGEIRIQPFLLQVEIRDLQLPDADGQPMLGFTRLFADFEIASLWHRAYTFREIRIDGPQLRAVKRPDGALNLADLASSSEPAQPDTPPPSVWIHRLGVGSGQVAYIDQARRQPFNYQLGDVGFEVEDLRTTPEGGDFRFSARSKDDTRFDWKGHFALAPAISSKGEFKIDGLPVPGVLDFLGDARPFTSRTGTIDLAGTYRVALAREMALDLDVPKVLVRDLGLLAPGEEAAWLKIPSIQVSGLKAALPAQTLRIEQVAVDALQAQAWLNADRSVNLAALFGAPAAASPVAAAEPAPAAGKSLPWTVTVGGVALTNAAIDFEDRALAPGTRYQIAPVNLRLAEASADLSKPLQVAMDAAVNGQARIDVEGRLTPAPLAASLGVRLEQLPLALLQPYVQPHAALTITDGQLAAAGQLELAPAGGGAPGFSFAGDVTVDRFKSVDQLLKQDLVHLGKLQVAKLRVTIGPDAVDADRIVVNDPYLRLIISPSRQTNIAAVLNPKGAAPASAAASAAQSDTPRTAAASAAPMPIRVREVRVDGMRLNFTDNLVQPNFAADVQKLAGTISGVSSARDARTQVLLKGQLGEFSPVSIEGDLQPFAFDRHTDMRLRFENIQLPIFNPYSGTLAGYSIAKGQLTTSLHYVINDRRLEAEHKIRIQQLEWGDASPSKGEATLPVKFATALLKDRHGVINLDVPVGGTLDDPTFRIGPIVWQVIGNLITKAVTAPFALLGALFEGAEDSQFADFAPGSAALDPALAGRLAALAKGLVEKPGLSLDVPIGTLSSLDRPALARRAFDEALAAATKARLGPSAPAYATLEPARQLEVLRTAVAAKAGPAAVTAAMAAASAPGAAASAAASASAASSFSAASAASSASSASAAAEAAPSAAIPALEQALRAAVTVPDSALSSLGEERALALTRALVADTGLEPTRIFRVQGGKVSAHEGRVRVELALK